jgi:cytochrome c5
MRTRWIFAASVLVLTWIPGALRAAEEAGCTQAAAAAATLANAAANEPAPAATALPIWAGLPTQPSSSQTPQGIDGKPLFLTTCSSCPPAPRCSSLHSCVLMHCC